MPEKMEDASFFGVMGILELEPTLDFFIKFKKILEKKNHRGDPY